MGCSGTRHFVNYEKDSLPAKPAGSYFHPIAASHFIRGCLYDFQGDYNSALLEFNEALLFDSSSVTIYNKIAEQYIKLKKFEHAEKILDVAINKHPRDLESYRLLAALKNHLQKTDETEAIFYKMLELDPSDIETRYNLITLLVKKNEPMLVVKQYEQILKIQGDNPELQLQIANIYLDNEKYKQANDVFLDFLKKYPDDERAYLGLAKYHLTKTDTVKAIDWYQKGLKSNRKFTTCLEELRDIYVKQKRWNDAIVLLNQSIENDTTNIDILLKLGELYYQHQDTVTAIEEFRKITERFPDDFRAYYSIGALLYQQRKWSEAANYFHKVIERKNEFVRGWLMLGLSHLRNDSMDDAKQLFENAVERYPENVDFNYFLGSILSRQKRTVEAIPYYEKCLRIEPDNLDAMSALAAAYDEVREYVKSDSLYEEALKIRTRDPLLMNNYSYSLSIRGDKLEYALELSQSAVAQDSTNGAFLDTLGWIHFKMGNYRQALKFIQRSNEFRKESPEVLEHLGDVYHKLNEPENAILYWKQAYDLDETRTWLLDKIGEAKE